MYNEIKTNAIKKAAVILATGRGQDESVFLREVLFCPIVAHAAQTCADAGIDEVYVISAAGEGKAEESKLKAAIDEVKSDKVSLIYAKTGAVTEIVNEIKKLLGKKNACADLLLLRGDIPFIDYKVLKQSFDHHVLNQTDATVLTTRGGDENRSAVWFSATSLKKALKKATDLPERCPLHLLPDLLWQNTAKIESFYADNPEFALRASSAKDIFELNTLLNERMINSHIEKGVEFLSRDGILIGQNVRIGYATQILPGTILKGNTVIGSHCVIGPNSIVSSCEVGDSSTFNASQGYNSKIGKGVTVGPFCHIRPNCVIDNNVHLGDFVEVKNSNIGEETHISHLTYVGDSDVGRRVNFGCGVVTVNYNGKEKNRCKIGDDAFIGCNTNLVAPVEVGESGYTAAGSTITENVPDKSLAIARARQVNKEGWNKGK